LDIQRRDAGYWILDAGYWIKDKDHLSRAKRASGIKYPVSRIIP